MGIWVLPSQSEFIDTQLQVKGEEKKSDSRK